MTSAFKKALTIGELKALLNNVPDDAVIFQVNSYSIGYSKNISLLSLNHKDKKFNSWLKNIKVYQCTEDKIKGVNNNLKNIVIFRS